MRPGLSLEQRITQNKFVSLSMRFVELLHLPLKQRCEELANFFECASLSVLHDIFPVLINSIFGMQDGGHDWHLRSITQEECPKEFAAMYHFFNAMTGPMFRMIYRLKEGSSKYLLPISYLPNKMQRTLRSGRWCSFYKNLVSTDIFRQQVRGLLLNPFDFFLFHFAIHGTFSRRTGAPDPRENERAKSLYLTLTADYVCIFLPVEPCDSVSLHSSVASGELFSNVTQQGRSTPIKYLLPQRLLHQLPTEEPEPLLLESVRPLRWRSESTLYAFLGVWLGTDLEESRDLPSTELIRCLRILVKRLHGFSSCSKKEPYSSMLLLRDQTPLMVSAHIIDFLRWIFLRWPLDDSFLDVMELWLSFIQPWRYQPNAERWAPLSIEPVYEEFVTANLDCYTQNFIALVRRLLKSDLHTPRNATLVFRLCKVFSQDNLLELLRTAERVPSYPGEITPNSRFLFSGCNPYDPYWKREMFYEPMFSEKFGVELRELLLKVREAVRLLEKYEQEPPKWLVFVTSMIPYKEQILEHAQNIVFRLEYAADILGQRFRIAVDDPETPSSAIASHDSTASSEISSFRANLMRGWFDPALLPVHSGEIACLVRFLHQLSSKLNLMFGEEVCKLWCLGGVGGFVARQMLMEPMPVNRFVWQPDGSKMLCSEQLPARICLRLLASKKVLAVIVFSFLLGHLLFGAPSFGFMALGLLAFVVKMSYAYIRALYDTIRDQYY